MHHSAKPETSSSAKNYHLCQARPVAKALATMISVLLMYLSGGSSQRSEARERDGFYAYCTSNLDGTGECTNEEDGRKFQCIIVPGQIISCPTMTSKSMECVWISGVTANQAQFWCDPEDEAALYGDLGSSNALPRVFENTLPTPKNPRNEDTENSTESIFEERF